MLNTQGTKNSNEISDQNRQKSMAMVLFLGISVFALGQALEFGNGFISLPGLLWLTVSIYFLLASVTLPNKSPFPAISEKFVFTILTLALVIQISELLILAPGDEPIAHLWQFRLLISLGGICALLSLIVPNGLNLWIRKLIVGLTFISIFIAGIWIIQGVPNPRIDVYLFQQNSSRALLNLQNPYAVKIPNIYPDTRYYGDQMVKNGMLTIGNPYPPLSIYLSFIGYVIAGDIRYSCLLAILLSGLILLSLNQDRIGLLITYLFLFTPRIFFVLEQSWTEPLVVMCGLVVVWCAIYKPSWVFIALGLLLASKQYMLFLLPTFGFLFPIDFNLRAKMRASLLTIGVAFLVTAPLAFWNFNTFAWNVGLAQWNQPFRFDSLSYAVAIAKVFGQSVTPYLPFAALCAALLISYRYLKPSPKSFAIAMAFGFVLFIAFNKQAFCNYYFLVIGILNSAIALSHRVLKLDEPGHISLPIIS
jgi:hypothetical protein